MERTQEGQQETFRFILWAPWISAVNFIETWPLVSEVPYQTKCWLRGYSVILPLCQRIGCPTTQLTISRPVACELNWGWIACFLVYELSCFLWFCHKTIKPRGSWWAVLPLGSRVTSRLLSCSRPREFSFTPGDATAMLTWVILLSHPSNDLENMWVNCQQWRQWPLKITQVKIRVENQVKLSPCSLWKFSAIYLHGCTHLYLSAEGKETVSWRLSQPGPKSFVLVLFVFLAELQAATTW